MKRQRRGDRAFAVVVTMFLVIAPGLGRARPWTTQAAKIAGNVTRVDGQTVTIEIESELWPRVGDPVRLGQAMPGFEGLVYMRGFWKVSAVTAEHVVAQPGADAAGAPSVDDVAEIESADPQPRPAAAYGDPGAAGAGVPGDGIPEWRRQQMADASYQLGRNNIDGAGVPRNPGAAAMHFRAAAEMGHIRAAHNLANLYAAGDGVLQDPAEAIRWYQYAADRGLPHAQRSLGSMYQAGLGVPRDFAQAMRFYRLAADQDEPLPKRMAIVGIGTLYAKGEGVSQDFAEAMRWFTRAAELGNSWGYFNVAVLHENGWGVPASRETAIRNYQEAARLGNERAQQWLRDGGIPW